MNVETPDFVSSLPPFVKPGSGNGVYRVRSASNPAIWHTVDVTLLQCDCKNATVGKSKQARKRLGYLPSSFFCRHLREALIYHAIAMICLLERNGK